MWGKVADGTFYLVVFQFFGIVEDKDSCCDPICRSETSGEETDSPLSISQTLTPFSESGTGAAVVVNPQLNSEKVSLNVF